MKQVDKTLLFILTSAALLLSGCNATKYLKENEKFYAGSEIKFDPQGKVGGKKELKKDLESMIVPAPNTEILGMRPGVWLFFRERNANKKKGLKAFIRRKFGQVPVLISDIKPDQTAKMLEGQLQNDGYFKSEVTYKLKERKKESKVIYNVLLYPPYKLRNIVYPSPKDSMYAVIIESLKAESLLKEKQRYDLARLQAEQQRIESEVENFGLFYFDDKHLIFEADSTVGEKEIDIRLRLEQGIPERARRIYRIGEVNVYPDYTLDSDTTKLKSSPIKVDSFNYYDITRKFKPAIITRVINLHKGNIYRTLDHDLTLSHLMDLGVFKFVNIQYAETNPDSNLLMTNIYLTPLKKRSIRAEFQTVSKSNSFVGPGLQVTFTDRNFLRGAELFQLKLNSSYEVQLSKRISGPLNSFELGAETSLTFPRFISPIRIDYSSKKYLPKTDFRLGFNFQNRVQFFTLNSLNLSAGYNWRESEHKSHELYPVDINFVQTFGETEEFENILAKNRFLKSSFDDQFILGSRYSYTLNTQLKPDLLGEFEERRLKTHSLYFNTTVQLAGNIMNALQRQFHKEEEDRFQLFHAAYSQFVRGEVDFRHYWQFDDRNKLASRILLGAGYAYGNSSYYDPELKTDVRVLPYIKQFAIGGSNSLRGFPARSVGPGSYSVLTDPKYFPPPKELPPFIDQRGDIKFESNVEWRFDIIKIFKGAVFADAGNIWLFSQDSSRLGGKFKSSNFLSELAVDAGVGLRFDFNFFVLRFDTAFPLRIPSRARKERWVFDEIDFGSSEWRSDNLIFNIAIGYPF
jgi:outer membrane protein insertion porin family